MKNTLKIFNHIMILVLVYIIIMGIINVILDGKLTGTEILTIDFVTTFLVGVYTYYKLH